MYNDYMIKGNNIWMGEPILIKIEPFFPFRGWDDIGYSFLVGQDGNVYEGRGWHHVGAHTQGYAGVQQPGVCRLVYG